MKNTPHCSFSPAQFNIKSINFRFQIVIKKKSTRNHRYNVCRLIYFFIPNAFRAKEEIDFEMVRFQTTQNTNGRKDALWTTAHNFIISVINDQWLWTAPEPVSNERRGKRGKNNSAEAETIVSIPLIQKKNISPEKSFQENDITVNSYMQIDHKYKSKLMHATISTAKTIETYYSFTVGSPLHSLRSPREIHSVWNVLRLDSVFFLVVAAAAANSFAL